MKRTRAEFVMDRAKGRLYVQITSYESSLIRADYRVSVPQGYYNIETMLKALGQGGCTVGVCGTCMDARGLKDTDLVEGTRRSSLNEMTEWTLWADEALVF
jgi:uncharacterized protein involved in oxidation of intracellular sulfur